jgi:hypothetical protein
MQSIIVGVGTLKDGGVFANDFTLRKSTKILNYSDEDVIN